MSPPGKFEKARQSYTTKIKIVSLFKKFPKKFLNLTLTLKIDLESPKSAKKAPNVAESKTKREAVLPK